MIKKILKTAFLALLFFILIFIGYFFLGKAAPQKEIIWGVNFSQKHSELLGLDWKENYLALFDDLKVKNLKLLIDWDLIEPENDKFNFEDLNWQLEEAQKRGAEVILVIGMKTGRWPECHIPNWATNLTKNDMQNEILNLIETVTSYYKNSTYSDAIKIWQIENEPLLNFGECPWIDKAFLKKEIETAKATDPSKPIIISDSGEWSFWFEPARLGDIVGTTMYRGAWFGKLNTYINYHLPPVFYYRKSQFIKKIFNKEVVVVELQAEPWSEKLLYDSSLEEQEKTMNPEIFKDNIEFARQTGLGEFYFWGAEWWYWLKIKQDKPDIWNEAKNLFTS